MNDIDWVREDWRRAGDDRRRQRRYLEAVRALGLRELRVPALLRAQHIPANDNWTIPFAWGGSMWIHSQCRSFPLGCGYGNRLQNRTM